MKLLEENTDVTLHDLGETMILRYDNKSTCDKKDKLDFVKIKTLCASKYMIKKERDNAQNGR